MKIPPNYTLTPEIIELITKIEAHRINFVSLKIPAQIKENIQKTSLLKSSLYSARIEGNPLELLDISFEKSNEINKLEIFNILESARFIETGIKEKEVTKEMLLELHKRTLKGIDEGAGHFRTEQSAIFNQAGVAVYIPPSPLSISKFLDELLLYINGNKERFPLVKAFIAHLVFEKIHPFLDGNGRVGRLLISLILKAKGWDFTFTIPFEENLDENKSDYYFHLDEGLKNTNGYLSFMLNVFLNEIEKVKEQIEKNSSKKEQLFLPPRQEEILNIVKEHSIISFDMIRRRFLKVPERTLRYDLKKLLDKGIIEKTGETKGRYYRARVIK
jgi:Fic family protein